MECKFLGKRAGLDRPLDSGYNVGLFGAAKLPAALIKRNRSIKFRWYEFVSAA